MVDIDNMPAGAELDALVAKAIGWKSIPVGPHDVRRDSRGKHDYWLTPEGQHKPCGWSPSTDWAAAGEVLETCRAAWTTVELRGNVEGWWCYMLSREGVIATTTVDTGPLAIARAAVKAAEKGGE